MEGEEAVNLLGTGTQGQPANDDAWVLCPTSASEALLLGSRNPLLTLLVPAELSSFTCKPHLAPR